jgi:DNA-binding response OmpR family regulator
MHLEAEADQRPPSILVADDDPHIVELVAFRLERAGYDVVRATDGREALRVLMEQPPDLAVLDVMMPVHDGYQITREIRRHEPTRHIPVILLSGRSQEDDVENGFGAGADDYLRKPFSPRELRARVHAILGRR